MGLRSSGPWLSGGLLCDYIKVEDLTHEVMEELMADAVTNWVARPVSAGTIIAARNAVGAFFPSYHPNLVSRPSRVSSFAWGHR